ncbi:preprotein translocase subunit SecG [Sphingomonas sp. NPDC092331]|jgi:preprotein translocase subunit SecG|uniref:preprotein translocase subunit SecG n=1 Tax=unclassified Sphingomonas TaxID=196159 RepID=UPI0031F4B343
MFTFLLIVQAFIAAGLVGVILLQKSEGGGLTSSGSPSGLMSARSAADFLTRTTAILATAFIAMSILLAFLAANRHGATIDASLQRAAPAAAPQAVPTTAPPGGAVPFAPGNSTAPAAPSSTQGNSAVPLAQ